MRTNWFFIVAILFINNTYAYKEFDKNILNECLDNVAIAGASAQCNDMYHYYPSVEDKSTKDDKRKGSKDKSEKINIAGFNVFNMLTGQTQYKDLDIISDIISQWDVVGAVEVLPAMGDDAKMNIALRKMLDNKKITLEEAKKAYRQPGYLKVLNLLRKKSPESKWAMIISPYTQSKTQELVAYFYKGDRVEIKETSHCRNEVYPHLQKPTILNWPSFESDDEDDDNDNKSRPVVQEEMDKGSDKITYKDSVLPSNKLALGCIPLFEENIEKQFSRIPFMASFKAGEFDFTLLSMHARFRAPGELGSKCEKDCLEAIKKMIDEEFDPENSIVPALNSGLLEKIIKYVKAKESNQIIAEVLTLEEKKIPEVMEASKLSPLLLSKVIKQVKANEAGESISLLKENEKTMKEVVAALKLKSSLLEKVLKHIKECLTDVELNSTEVQDALKLSSNVLQNRLTYLIDARVFTRFYEIKKILEFMNKVSEGGEKDVLLVGDFNLESKEIYKNKVDYWSKVLPVMPGSGLYVTDKTSLSPKNENEGMASNYDHFIFVPENVKECDSQTGHAFDFKKGQTFLDANLPDLISKYVLDTKSSRVQEVLDDYKKSLKGTLVLKGSKLVEISEKEIEQAVKKYEERVFKTQKKEADALMYLQEIVSDHLPISMNCDISLGDDD